MGFSAEGASARRGLMSELFAVEVAEVSAQSVKLAVRSVHPDSGPVTSSRNLLKNA